MKLERWHECREVGGGKGASLGLYILRIRSMIERRKNTGRELCAVRVSRVLLAGVDWSSHVTRPDRLDRLMTCDVMSETPSSSSSSSSSCYGNDAFVNDHHWPRRFKPGRYCPRTEQWIYSPTRGH